ncbi:hypothetical protein LRP67_20600 [Nocardioides sp. cx-169]|uniref:hypothetical protein n=1 Tax=Nocardioides sp. cx-169 TaxID=2899080 RepID=UPI001E62B2A4|nr:hypothetical protein [Nocardioides sp. cx-169]MCD4536499.1 hypothetical protein [Nocardioides sp. cx-169]
MRLSPAAASLAVLAAGLAALPATSPAQAESKRPPTCLGQDATIVGKGHVRGTRGRDVIVATAPTTVAALGGDDLICVVGTGTTKQTKVRVGAGEGDDRVVDRVRSPHKTDIRLAGGDDRYTASSSLVLDRVEAGPGRDVVSTGRGDDQVTSGVRGRPNHDQVNLGPGDDRLFARGVGQTSSRLRGGLGRDELDASDLGPGGQLSGGPGAWMFDNAAGTATYEGTVLTRWGGFEEFDLPWGTGPLTFRGGPASESIWFYNPDRASYEVLMGGGDDEVKVSDDITMSAPVDGGGGRDTILAYSYHPSSATASLADQQLRFRVIPGVEPDPGYAESTVELRGFENAEAFAPVALAIGDAGPNELQALGCGPVARGGDGDDSLEVRVVRGEFGCFEAANSRARAYGEQGDDRLLGGPFTEILVGGPGLDRADGRERNDICDAEREVRCERNP